MAYDVTTIENTAIIIADGGVIFAELETELTLNMEWYDCPVCGKEQYHTASVIGGIVMLKCDVCGNEIVPANRGKN